MTVRKSAAKVDDKPASNDDEELGIPQVAIMLKKRYQYTRDLMLSGALGEPKYIDGRLTVTRRQVHEYQTKTAPAAAPKPSANS